MENLQTGEAVGHEVVTHVLGTNCYPFLRAVQRQRWCPRQDSNPRPTVYKTAALPAELQGHGDAVSIFAPAVKCRLSAANRPTAVWQRPPHMVAKSRFATACHLGATMTGQLPKSLTFVAADADDAREAAKRLSALYGQSRMGEAEVIVALGGDGFMLQTLRENIGTGRRIYGMNRGTIGFLMN